VASGRRPIKIRRRKALAVAKRSGGAFAPSARPCQNRAEPIHGAGVLLFAGCYFKVPVPFDILRPASAFRFCAISASAGTRLMIFVFVSLCRHSSLGHRHLRNDPGSATRDDQTMPNRIGWPVRVRLRYFLESYTFLRSVSEGGIGGRLGFGPLYLSGVLCTVLIRPTALTQTERPAKRCGSIQ
jgi:hypothetical protein